MISDPHAVQISVDGSHYPNDRRKSGYAGIVVYPDDPTEYEVISLSFWESTINRMELSAVIAAMEWVREQGIGRRYGRVQIFTDSLYVVNGQSSAMYQKQAGWRNAAGRPIENPDLWKKFLSVKSKAGVRIDICKVQNKSTPLLKKVDKLAKTAAKTPHRIDRGLVIGKIGRAKIKGSPTMFPAARQVLVIRIVRSRAIGPTGENKFVFEVFDEITRTCTSKHYAYCTQTVGARLHRQRGFRVKMNGDAKYPQILEVIEEVPLSSKPSSPDPDTLRAKPQ